MAEDSAPMAAFRVGARVRRMQRIGLVLEVPSRQEITRSKRPAWVEVMPEGSSTSRTEFWPVAEISLLPQAEQLPAIGGSFEAPKGYPLVTRNP